MIQTLFGPEEKDTGLLGRLKEAVTKTRAHFVSRLEDIVKGEKEIDARLLGELEGALIAADLGVRTASEVLEKIRVEVDRNQLSDAAELKSHLRRELLEILLAAARDGRRNSALRVERPHVIFVVGVNGTGKTTTIGKLAYRLQKRSEKILICAADTFRAAAIEQLEIWAQRIGADLVKQKSGADSSAVLFDSLAAAKARGMDCVIVDTAGRLHTKTNLMAELEKMRRIAARHVPSAPHEVLLVIDATTGQNGLAQAREFAEHAGVTGIVLTKLDGTAKGGIVVAIARELKLPIQYIGTGEKIEDLVPFDPEQFINSLFD